MAPQDVDDEQADDCRREQRGGKLFEQQADLLGTDLPAMPVRIQLLGRPGSGRCLVRAGALARPTKAS